MFKIWIKLALMLVLVKICILEKTPHDSWWENNTCFLLLLSPKTPKHPSSGFSIGLVTDTEKQQKAL